MASRRILRTVGRVGKYALISSGVAVTGGYIYLTSLAAQSSNERKNDMQMKIYAAEKQDVKHPVVTPPTRNEQLKNLQSGVEYDVLVIGGGATGCGVALDASTRGLKTALVEMDDFASGTSSRSTKLIHGGIRYLYQAIWGFDREQFRMVKEALAERANLLAIAPHLSYPLPIMLPVYRWWQVPYFWAGIKMYDVVAGRQLVKPSYFLSKRKCLEHFPMLKAEKLCGGIVYYDGGHNDARMCLAVGMTAARHGCHIANHCEVLDLIKQAEEGGGERVAGVVVRDSITGKTWEVRAKCVINATGPFSDTIRHMDSADSTNICQPSAGVHLVLPDYYSPSRMGLLDPATSDGRVIFFLPWEEYTIAGTTDRACPITHHPSPTEEDIQFILQEIRNYLSPDIEVRRGDVMSAWAGIRPLVLDPNSKDTASVARNHIVHVSDKKLVTVAGGKWTTYRSMAQDTVDAAVEACGLQPKNGCVTEGLILEGGHSWTRTLFIRLVQDFGLETAVAKHLSHLYGDKAYSVAKMSNITGKRWPVLGSRIHSELPFIEGEVRYGCRREMACTAVDMIGRRLPLSFLNVHAAEEALTRIVDIMAEELKWDKNRKKSEMESAREFLQNDMGSALGKTSRNVPINFSRDEINKHIEEFNRMDRDKKGFITVNDLRSMFKNKGERVTEDQLRDILCEVDLNKNGNIDMGEYLELMSALRTGAIAYSRFAHISKMQKDLAVEVQRSGGGV